MTHFITLTQMRQRKKIEDKLKAQFNLTMMGKAKWYLGMHITQDQERIMLDQSQYAKNITSRIEKNFENLIKGKDLLLPNSFVPKKDDSPKTFSQTEEITCTIEIFVKLITFFG